MKKAKLNKKYNRLESSLDHFYIEEIGGSKEFDHEYDGAIKCKLGHGHGFSLIVPELIFLGKDFTSWLQPFAFLPSMVAKSEDEYGCTLYLDVAGLATIKVVFTKDGFISNLRDHSQLFNCKLYTVKNLQEHVSGTSIREASGDILLDFFHHSTRSNITAIESSGHFRASSWNIQGTKRIQNTHFVYLTWLDKITKASDLRSIAMSSEGTIELRRDFAQLPKILPPNWKSLYSKDVRVLTVYRESTPNRRSTIKVQVACDALAPQQLYMHMDDRGASWYQITCPFIHRVAVNPGNIVNFGSEKKIRIADKALDYCIVGDACDLDGLDAPYDEENTDFIMKYEKTTTNYLEFWFSNGNTDLYSNKVISKLDFNV